MKLNNLVTFLLLTTLIQYSYTLIAFDCGGENLNITVFSLNDVGQCFLPKLQPEVTEKYIQLVQISEYSLTSVKQCKVSITRTIATCGTLSHTRPIKNGHINYLRDVTRSECDKLFKEKQIYINNKYTFQGAEINKTVDKNAILAGKLEGDSCTGETFYDWSDAYPNSLVTAHIKVTLMEYTAMVQLDADKIMLRSGITCQLSKGECIDIEEGMTFWSVAPNNTCDFSNYDVLYEGMANKTFDSNYKDAKNMYTVNNDASIFAITQTDTLNICGEKFRKTDYEKLFILETEKNNSIITKKKIMPQNVNLLNYINSKFVYTENHIKNQINRLYENVLQQRCELEQQVLKNTLMFATLSPTDFAMELAKEKGYTSVVMGEVVYLIKCMPVEVTIKRLKECYQQLPVERGNETYFLSPRTHILMKKGTQIDCHPILPPLYYLENNWFSITPRLTITHTPAILKLTTRSTWDYLPAGNLANSGVYSQQEMKNLRTHIMFPLERDAVLNNIARGLTGQETVSQGLNLSDMLDEISIKKIVDRAWDSVWGKFTTFGTASAGFIGLYFIIRLIKIFIDTILRVYQLHDVFGWSFHIILAIWDSLTVLVLHLASTRDGTTPPPPSGPNEDEDTSEPPKPDPTPTASNFSQYTLPNPIFYFPNETHYPQFSNMPIPQGEYPKPPPRSYFKKNTPKQNEDTSISIPELPSEYSNYIENQNTSDGPESTGNSKDSTFQYPIGRQKK